MSSKIARCTICAVFLCWCFLPRAASAMDSMKGPAPIPPAEQGLPTFNATHLATAANNGETLEGAIFDKDGNLLFCDVSSHRVMRLNPDNELTTILKLKDYAPCGLAFHKDGRLFVVANNLRKKVGLILATSPDGKTPEIIISDKAGYLPNDLVFDANGGFYFSDFSGSATKPGGGIFYVSPDFGSISTIIPNMSQGNGVALSPNGKVLWATEYANNRLHRVNLDGPTSVSQTGSKVPYHFIGPAPDSMRTDADGNVYVAMVGQGRVMIFNANGFPIGQILLPERELGNNLRSTSLAIHPQKPELRIVAGNTADAPSRSASIFTAPALTHGQSQTRDKTAR